MSCGGSSNWRVPITSGGCSGPTRYLYVSNHSTGCGGHETTFSVDSGKCGAKVPASEEDIRCAFENMRRSRGW